MFAVESARMMRLIHCIDEAVMLSNLLKDRRDHLKHVQTEVRYPDGQVVIESGYHSGSSSPQVLPERRLGFIPDLTPDLGVAVVLPGLLMGSQNAAFEERVLRRFAVSHILDVGSHAMTDQDEPEFREKIVQRTVEMLDIPETPLIGLLPYCFSFIDGAREKGGCCLVHCNAGVSRSAAVVIAYLMKSEGMTYRSAHDYLKSLRPCIRPNDGFIRQLLEYEEDLFA
ncbi:unnamed protein product [Notodromas monacha]|uniref:Dual specificity protein phosphatase 19 n=1 Tax=Notodromas monacha TaxID=399045 RepID=A0A7R9BSX8_9CRUS|nr:unnamed protein product [Notodromas monacha]CAG0920074.1 unnamed protein product [Notodromas monacha]